MKLKKYIIFSVVGLFFLAQYGFAQEDEMADVTSAIVEDTFQEHFFEGLKQKGIENYDKAVEQLLEAKKLQPNNLSVDFE